MLRPNLSAMTVLASFAGLTAAQADTAASHADVIEQPGEEIQQPANFDGIWQGTITFDKDSFVNELTTPAAGTAVRIEIHDVVVRVFAQMQPGSPYSEFMPGDFHIAPVIANAVIFGSHYSGVWTETWAFVITKKTDDALLVNFTRVVNNNVPLTDPASKFSTRGFGEFTRVKP